MSSSPAYAIFDAPIHPERPPISDAIRGLLGIANETTRTGESVRGRKGTNEEVVVDAEVDGSHYRLVRMPKAEAQYSQAALSMSQPEVFPVANTERRINIGEFRRVLVAEHDRRTRLNLQRMLQKWGFEVALAKNGADALNVLEQHRPPELAILSRRLPGIDGVELCRRISDRAKECSPYVFIVAGPNERRSIVSAMESGAADYLTTPLEASELRARLIVASRILKRQENLITARDLFRTQARNDSLTGVLNRRAILEMLEDELERGARNDRPTGVLLVDLDHFKRVNDLYGHLVGDTVLSETARRLSETLRSYDSIGRFGGEEFLIVVPGSSQDELCELAERVRATMDWKPVHVGKNKIRITLSVGATIAPAREKSTSNVIAVADAALYKAKRVGRNRVAYGARRSKGIFKIGMSLSPISTKGLLLQNVR